MRERILTSSGRTKMISRALRVREEVRSQVWKKIQNRIKNTMKQTAPRHSNTPETVERRRLCMAICLADDRLILAFVDLAACFAALVDFSDLALAALALVDLTDFALVVLVLGLVALFLVLML